MIDSGYSARAKFIVANVLYSTVNNLQLKFKNQTLFKIQCSAFYSLDV